MSVQYRGRAYRAYLPLLPRNLVLFDGHCRLCQTRIRYVLERNFSYFHILSYFAPGEEQRAQERLDQHRMFFASLDSTEGKEIRRLFMSPPPPHAPSVSTASRGQKNEAARGNQSAAMLTSPSCTPGGPLGDKEVVVMLIERVSSAETLLLNRVRGKPTTAERPVAASGSGLFASPTTASAGASPAVGSVMHRTQGADVVGGDTDLLVSTNFTAVCRIGMKLDRFLPSAFFWVLHVCVPLRVGDWWFDRFVTQRRRRIWGTTEEDVTSVGGSIQGLEQRQWRGRRNVRPLGKS